MDGNSVPSRFEQLWSVEQTAEYLSLSVKTLYGWRGRRYGPPSYRIGNLVRYRPGEVHAGVDERVMSPEG
jgi:predicted DNA-binding transcriptional regulator AlpA